MEFEEFNYYLLLNAVRNLTDKLPNSNDPLTYLHNTPFSSGSSFFVQPTSSDEVAQVVRDLKDKKSSEWDGVPNFSIKQNIDILEEILANIFNQSFSTGKFPQKFKLALVIPLHKKDDKQLVSSGISTANSINLREAYV